MASCAGTIEKCLKVRLHPAVSVSLFIIVAISPCRGADFNPRFFLRSENLLLDSMSMNNEVLYWVGAVTL